MAKTFDEVLEIEIVKAAAQAGVNPAELRKVVKDVPGLIAYEQPATDQVRAECRVQLALDIMTGEWQRHIVSGESGPN